MTTSALLTLCAVVAFASFVQGSVGVGFALVVAPVMSLFVPALMPATLLILMLPLNAYVAWRERGALDYRSCAWVSGGRLLGTLGGLWVLAVLSARALNLAIGISTIAAAAVTLVMPAFRANRGAYTAAGLVTGVTETATGIGGPPLALVYQHHSPAAMRATVALCFLIGELISLAFLLQTGRVAGPQLAGALQLLPALGLGALLSRFAHHRIDARSLRAFVLLFAIVSGAVLILRA